MEYKNNVLENLRYIPYINIKLEDYTPISLYEYFEKPNIIEIIIEYLSYNLLSQLLINNIDINKIDYI